MARDKLQAVREHLDAYSRGDWAAYKQGLAEDAIYEEEATQRTARGPDEIVKLVKGWKDAFPDLKATIKSSFVSGDSMVLELEWAGTQLGELRSPLGTFSPTGKFGKVAAVQVLRFEGDDVIEMRHYFDLMTVIRQLGIGPFAQAQPQAADR